MNVTRESVATSLLTQLQTANNFISDPNAKIVTFSRRAKIWSDVNASDQPAAFLVGIAERGDQSQVFGVYRWELEYRLIVYARVGTDPASTLPDTLCNEIIDGIESALQPPPPGAYGQPQLGGIVQNVWIDGSILIDTGILDQQIAILIPIKCITGS